MHSRMVERLDADAATAATGLEATSSAQVRILFVQGHVLSLCANQFGSAFQSLLTGSVIWELPPH